MIAPDSEDGRDARGRPGFEAALRELAAELAPRDRSAGGLPPGTIVGGHFEVVRRLGSGGMGVVHLARDTRLDRAVALKLVRDRDLGRDTRRLEREARAMAKLAHPHVVAVFEVGHHDERVFIAMELVDGGSARQWASEHPRTTDEILDVYAQAAEGLAAAHAAGLVHRDFKPDNVLVGRDGRARVGDFGLARASSSAETTDHGAPSQRSEATESSHTDGVGGTPGYLAPELYLGAPPSPASDQFAFGVALFEALFERPPYPPRGRSMATTVGSFDDDGLPRRVPAWLCRVLERCIATAPDARFPAMQAVLDALARGRGRARRVRLGLAAVAGLVAVAGLSVALAAGVRASPCTDAEAIAGHVWNDARRDAIATAAADDPPATLTTLRVAQTVVDAWLAQWIVDRRESCMATRVHGSQSEALLDRSVVCLDDRLADLDALVDTLANEPDARARADAHASALRETAPCRDPTYLAARVAPLVDPDERAEAERIAKELRRVGLTRTREADLDAQRTRVAALLDDAERLGHAPTRATVEIAAGRLDLEADQREQARARWRRAHLDAGTAGDDDTAARAALELAYLAGGVEDRADAAEAWLDVVTAGIASGRVDPGLRSKLELTRSYVLQRAQDYAGAVTAARTAVELAQAIGDPHALYTARLELGAALDAAGDHRAAIEEYSTLIDELTAAYGDDHPLLGDVIGNRGLAHYYAHRPAEALDDQRRALAIDLAHGGENGSAANTMLNLGLALLGHGRVEEGIVEIERGLQIWRRLGDPREQAPLLDALGYAELQRDDPVRALVHFRAALEIRRALPPGQQDDIGDSYRHVADAQMLLGDFGQALAGYRESLVAWDRIDPTHPYRAWPLYGMARASFATGALEDAATYATAVLELAERREVDPAIAAEARFERARAWWRIDARPAALDEAQRARAELLPLLGDGHKNVVEIDEWLRARTSAAPP